MWFGLSFLTESNELNSTWSSHLNRPNKKGKSEKRKKANRETKFSWVGWVGEKHQWSFICNMRLAFSIACLQQIWNGWENYLMRLRLRTMIWSIAIFMIIERTLNQWFLRIKNFSRRESKENMFSTIRLQP